MHVVAPSRGAQRRVIPATTAGIACVGNGVETMCIGMLAAPAPQAAHALHPAPSDAQPATPARGGAALSNSCDDDAPTAMRLPSMTDARRRAQELHRRRLCQQEPGGRRGRDCAADAAAIGADAQWRDRALDDAREAHRDPFGATRAQYGFHPILVLEDWHEPAQEERNDDLVGDPCAAAACADV